MKRTLDATDVNDDEDEDSTDKLNNRFNNNSNKSWDDIQVDEKGELVIHKTTEREKIRLAKLNRITDSIRRGLIRFIVIALDLSKACIEDDIEYRPLSRLRIMINSTIQFLTDFFDQNPMSQACICITRDRKAEKYTDLSGNLTMHKEKLNQLLLPKYRGSGEASLKHLLTVSLASLEYVPSYGTREIVILYCALNTCDVGDIHETIEIAKEKQIRCSVISLSAEVFISKRLTELTKGTFAIAMDSTKVSELLLKHIIPTPSEKESQEPLADAIRIGFPERIVSLVPFFALTGRNWELKTVMFQCPRCHCRVSELPAQCQVCRLQLSSSTHIARSHHHLFPVPNFDEVDNQSNNLVTSNSLVTSSCTGCQYKFGIDAVKLKCPTCQGTFCSTCDFFIHDSLHNCPGCNI